MFDKLINKLLDRVAETIDIGFNEAFNHDPIFWPAKRKAEELWELFEKGLVNSSDRLVAEGRHEFGGIDHLLHTKEDFHERI